MGRLQIQHFRGTVRDTALQVSERERERESEVGEKKIETKKEIK